MFVVYPAEAAPSTKEIIERWADRHALTSYACGEFVVRCSARWNAERSRVAIHFYEGLAYDWPADRGGQVCSRLRHPARAVGHFTSIQVGPEGLEVTRSLCRSTDVFHTIFENTPIVCSELSVLVAVRGGFDRQRLDVGHCRDFVGYRQGFGGRTAFEHIGEVMLGERITLDRNGAVFAQFVNRPFVSDADIVDTLTSTLAVFTEPFDKPVLMFSGGLDSSALLWALRSNGTNVLALHVESHASLKESEYREAVAVALDIGCEVTRSVPDHDDHGEAFQLDPRVRSSSPHDVPLLGSGKSSTLLPEEAGLIVTGHGGDHVFVQNPENNVAFSSLRGGDLVGFLQVVRKLSRLKGRDSYGIIRDNLGLLLSRRVASRSVPEWLPVGKSNGGTEHYLLRGLDPRSAKYAHLWTILLALHASRPRRGGNVLLNPFLLQNIIGHVLDRPVEDMFSESHDRIMLREPIYARAGKAFAWRRTKRASSTLMFEALSQSGTRLIKAFSDSSLVAALGIERSALIADVRYNCTVGLSPTFKHIINLYKIDAHLRSIELQSKETLSS
ncbi:hypothetical protein ACVI1J_007172 [Bradyrhizobium diazoefficiens]